MRRTWWVLVCALAGCELTEVTVPVGEPVTIVQGVLSRTRPTQFVVVEESRTGAQRRRGFGSVVPPDEPRLPIVGARVLLTYEGASPCAERVVELAPRADTSGVYETDRLCPLEPGDVVSLRVLTPGGAVVTGRTRIAGAAAAAVRIGGDTSVFDFEELTAHRRRDTIRFAAEPIVARGVEVEMYREDDQDDPVFFFFNDSLGVALAADLVNPFEGDSGETIFRAGVAYLLTAAIADTNYYDFLRSRSDPFTGRGFINHLDGGIGVFGNVEAHTWVVRFVDDLDDPREGTYRITGGLDGVPVDLTLDLYLDALDPGAFSAFVGGTWYEGSVRRSLDGHFGGTSQPFVGGEQDFTASFSVPDTGESPVHYWVLRGRRAPRGNAFEVEVNGEVGGAQSVVARVQARQTSGPGG